MFAALMAIGGMFVAVQQNWLDGLRASKFTGIPRLCAVMSG
jgi:hypothetical protein